MTAPADLFEEIDPYQGFDGLEFADEKFAFLPGKKVFAPGGLSSATLQTPKGPAKLNLPSPVPTLTQYRTLEQTVNTLTQRLNATNAQLLQVRRELASRPRDPMGGGMMGMMFTLLTQRRLREDLEGHTHTGNNTTPVLPASSGGKFDSILPLLMLQPNLFGTAPANQSANAQQQDAMSPLLLAMLFMD